VHPAAFDFFLNSHSGLLGTNRPAHYTTLADGIGFGADGLQLLTYWLTYLYCACTRSISVVLPAYYAHLAAYRWARARRGRPAGRLPDGRRRRRSEPAAPCLALGPCCASPPALPRLLAQAS
jgi:hypothetical protein